MAEDFKKFVAGLLKEGAAGAEHERLKADLAEWAGARGYSKTFNQFSDGSIPDALRAKPNAPYLFVGDAKDAKTETIDVTDTVSRIGGYIKNFALLLAQYKGGIIAVATNSAKEAARWLPTLNTLAQAANLTDGTGGQPNFKIDHPKAKTWIVWW
jgi:hypothetical protein